MYQKVSNILIVIAVSFGLLACATGQMSMEQKVEADGGMRMSPEEATAHLSGNTQKWSNGGAYYYPQGRLDFIWDGKEFYHYTWETRGDGQVCIKNQVGLTTSCSAYFKHEGTVWTVVTEEFGEIRTNFGGPDTIMDGKRLSDLEPGD